MANYPIYQRQERVTYPDPKTMVVNWAGAVDRVRQGIVEGMEISRQKKESQARTAMQAAQTKNLLETLQMKQAEHAVTMTNLQLRNKINQFDADQREQDEAAGIYQNQRDQAIQKQKITAAAQKKTIDALNFLAEHPDLPKNLSTQLDLFAEEFDANAGKPYTQLRLLDDFISSIRTQAEAVGFTPEDLIATLPNEPQYQGLKGMLGNVTRAGFAAKRADIKIPIATTPEVQGKYRAATAEYEAAKEAGDKEKMQAAQLQLMLAAQEVKANPSRSLNALNVVWMPIDNARAYFNLGGENAQMQWQALVEKFGGDSDFQKYASKDFANIMKQMKEAPPDTDIIDTIGKEKLTRTVVKGGKAYQETVPMTPAIRSQAGKIVDDITQKSPEAIYKLHFAGGYGTGITGSPYGSIGGILVKRGPIPKTYDEAMNNSLVYYEEEEEKYLQKLKDTPRDDLEKRLEYQEVMKQIRIKKEAVMEQLHLKPTTTPLPTSETSQLKVIATKTMTDTIKMKFPDNTTKLVPIGEKQKYLNYGGVIVQ